MLVQNSVGIVLNNKLEWEVIFAATQRCWARTDYWVENQTKRLY